MRLVATLVILLAAPAACASSAAAQGLAFTAPQTVGKGHVASTESAAGEIGVAAILWQTQDSLWAASRAGVGAAWQPRRLESYTGWPTAVRDPHVVMTPTGTAVATWASVSRHALYASVAPRGGPFARPFVVGSLVRPASGRPGSAVVGDNVLVTWSDMAAGHAPQLHTAVIHAAGRASRPSGIGLRGLAPAIAATNRGALVVYLRGLIDCRPSQYSHNCRPRPLAAAMLDSAGRRRGRELLITADMKRATAAGRPQLATGPGNTALVSWLQSSLPFQILIGTPYTRLLKTRPLRPAAPARKFPSQGGPDARSPALLLWTGGESIAAGIGPFGYASVISGASSRDGSDWSGLQRLSPPSGWSTSPRIVGLPGGAALAVLTHSGSAATDAVRTVLAWSRPRGGRFSPVDLSGERYTTRSPAGASAASADDGSVVVAWPARGGGVAVASGR